MSKKIPYLMFENEQIKSFRSENYNYDFNKETGFFARWGKTVDDDPQFSPFGPEIADIEITTSCSGIPKTYPPNNSFKYSESSGSFCQNNERKSPCLFCYKANTVNGINMPFETFKNMIDKFPKLKSVGNERGESFFITQIAFGGDAEAKSNPDLWKMMEYCRSVGIISNITVANIDDETADKLVKYCGAVACSKYSPKDYCYDSVKKLTDRGLKQVNIHSLVSQETLNDCFQVIDDVKSDSRLEKLNAVVYLMLKKKGRGEKLHPLDSLEDYKRLLDYATEKGVNFGADSCSCSNLLRSLKDREDYEQIEMMVEPCESFGVQSSYFSADSVYYPCSFSEGVDEWAEGINMLEVKDFLKDVWFSEKLNKWRKISLAKKDAESGCRICPLYDLELKSCEKEKVLTQ